MFSAKNLSSPKSLWERLGGHISNAFRQLFLSQKTYLSSLFLANKPHKIQSQGGRKRTCQSLWLLKVLCVNFSASCCRVAPIPAPKVSRISSVTPLLNGTNAAKLASTQKERTELHLLHQQAILVQALEIMPTVQAVEGKDE